MTTVCISYTMAEGHLSVLVVLLGALTLAVIAYKHPKVPYQASKTQPEREKEAPPLPPMEEDQPLPSAFENLPTSTPQPSPSFSDATPRNAGRSSILISSETPPRARGTCATCGFETTNLYDHMRKKHGLRKRDPDYHKEAKVECGGCGGSISKSNISTHWRRCKGPEGADVA